MHSTSFHSQKPEYFHLRFIIEIPRIDYANLPLYFPGMCPLHMASWAGKDQIVKTLIENRALVNLPSFSGETPLLLASQHGYANVVSFARNLLFFLLCFLLLYVWILEQSVATCG